MLELKNLTKIYKTKGGVEVRALDGVSVKFKETGLVFFLGKSGSGKSTLLNLAGGLDEPTSGEIVVMGRSSKDFTQNDFDSYRNTYVGFVFQEYNVLEEFNVEENVALALELQGKTQEREKVKQILEEVELGGLEKRRPNTLSGGQKQRIAIARALVKDPQIIMADEPTGALDSATGKQVFDTLKKLSQTRLVLVVSHDRDFAEEYGDRIIELKDGKIVSDVTKTRERAEKDDAAVKQVGEDTLFVRAGEPSEETIRAISEFLRRGKGEIVLTKGEAEIERFRRANRIDGSGAKTRFVQTDESAIPQKEYGETAFIRSRLPARKAIKLGASGLRLKPFRLALTVFLSFVAFTMFGLLSTLMLYNPKTVMKRSFMGGSYEYVLLEKKFSYLSENLLTGEKISVQQPANFTPAEVSSFGENAFGTYSPVKACSCYNFSLKANKINYYRPDVTHFSYIPAGNALRETIVGSYPQNAGEIAVSSYFVECAKAHTFTTVNVLGDGKTSFGTQKTIESAEDLIGEYLLGLPGAPLKVTGVFDSGTISSAFDALKRGESGLNGITDSVAYRTYLSTTPHTLVLTSEDYFRANAEAFDLPSVEYFRSFTSGTVTMRFTNGEELSEKVYRAAQVYDGDAALSLPVRFFGERTSGALAPDEAILPLSDLFEYYDRGYFEGAPSVAGARADREEFQKIFRTLTPSAENEDGELYRAPSQEEIDSGLAYLFEVFDALPLPQAECGQGVLKIVGFTLPDYVHSYAEGFYASEELLENYTFRSSGKLETNYIREADALYPGMMARVVQKGEIESLLGRVDVLNGQNDVTYLMQNILYTNVLSANRIIELLSLIFLIAGLVLALFAALLLFNFISMTIANKTKEIGILRAVGARGIDVFKIFFLESGIIVGGCILLAILGSVVITAVLNGYLKTAIGLEVALFVFGPLSVLIMFAVAAVVALLATFLPVYLAAKRKPVESIRSL